MGALAVAVVVALLSAGHARAAPARVAEPPTPVPSASTSPSPSPAPTPAPRAPAPPRALPAPTPQLGVLASDSLQLFGLRSLAVRTVAARSGPVKVIELVMRASTLGGMELRLPCAGGVQLRTTAAQARVTGDLTLQVTALQLTVLAVPLTLLAAELPDGQLTLPGVTLPPLPADALFRVVRMLVLSIRAGAMALDGSQATSVAC